jgi:hypothetical protein
MKEVIYLIDKEVKVSDTNYLLNGTITVDYDPSYGADADGNRSEPAVFLREHDVEVLNDDDLQVEVSYKELDLVIEYIEQNWRNYL